MSQRIYSMLGMAQRAGRIQSGMFLTEESVRGKTAMLVIIATDAKKNTVKTLQNKCSHYDVPLRYFGTAEALGHAVGKELRSCAAITDAGFAKKLMQLIDACTMNTPDSENGNEQQQYIESREGNSVCDGE